MIDKLMNVLFFCFNSFSYQLTAASLPFFEKYFDIKFRLPKIDMVAVPDFGFSGMEVCVGSIMPSLNIFIN